MFVQGSKSGVSDLHPFLCSQHGVHGIWAKHLLWHWPQDVYRIFPAGFPSKGHDGRVVCNDALRLLCLTPGHQNKFYQSMSGMPLYDLCVLVWKHLIFLYHTVYEKTPGQSTLTQIWIELVLESIHKSLLHFPVSVDPSLLILPPLA